jgi:hypothetical protein
MTDTRSSTSSTNRVFVDRLDLRSGPQRLVDVVESIVALLDGPVPMVVDISDYVSDGSRIDVHTQLTTLERRTTT